MVSKKSLLARALWMVAAFATTGVHAELISTVDNTDIDEMQTLQLTVRITGTDQAEAMDLSPLEVDFEVQNTSTQSQFRSVNGRVSSWVEYHITLRPKRTGRLTIPALELQGNRSAPIAVQVHPVSSAVKSQIDRLVYFDVSLDKDEVYVQAQAILTRRLYYTAGVQIYGDLPGAPELDNAVVLTLGEASSNATMIEGRRYGVLEQRYAIFPEQSGTLTIPGFFVTSSVQLADRGRRGVRVKAAEKTLNVLPVPSEFPSGKPWFPASDVTLSERWQPDQTQLAAGDALSRTILIQAFGATGSGIPPLQVRMPEQHFKQYPQSPQIEDDAQGHTVKGSREQAYELIVTHGGQVRTSPVEVVWWDTDVHALRMSRLETREMQVTGPPPGSAAQQAPTGDAKPARQEPVEAEQAANNGRLTTWFVIVLSGLAFVALLWGVYRATAGRLKRFFEPSRASQTKQLMRNANTAGEIQFQLRCFAAERWQVGASDVASEIRRRCKTGTATFNALNALGYSKQTGSIDEARKQALTLVDEIAGYKTQRTAKTNPLPPLYPA